MIEWEPDVEYDKVGVEQCGCKGLDPVKDEPWVPLVCGECGHRAGDHDGLGCFHHG